MQLIRSVFSLLVLESIALPSLPVMAAEKTVFGFKLENGVKRMTLVKTDSPASYRYRFGKENLVELEFPKGATSVSEAFELDTQPRFKGAPRFTLSFRNGAFRYSIYEEFNEFNKPVSVGIVVKNMKTRKETEFKGDRKTIIGSLASLKDDALIPKISAPKPLDTVPNTVCRVSLMHWEGGDLSPRVTKWELSAETIRSGLPQSLMQKLNMDIQSRFERALAQDKSAFKKGEAVYLNKACDAVEPHEFQQLTAGKKLDEVSVTDSLGFSPDMLGSKIIALEESYYSESAARMDAGAENVAFYRIADGKEVARKQLFTKAGLAIMDKEVRSRFDCEALKELDSMYHYQHPCKRFKSVIDQGYFYSRGRQVHVGFSRDEISTYGDEVGIFDGREFDSFLN